MIATQRQQEIHEGPFARAYIPALTTTDTYQNLLTTILDVLPQFVALTDSQGKLLYLNPAARKMVGIREEEDISCRAAYLLLPESARIRIANEGMPQALRKGKWSGEVRITGNNNEEIPAWMTLMVHKNFSGAVECFSLIAQDIRQQKQADEEKHRMKEEMKWLGFIPL